VFSRHRISSPSIQLSSTDDLAGNLEPLTEAKRRASSAFEKRYLMNVMERAKGSVSEAARLSGLDRTNFRRLLQRHGIDPTSFKSGSS
jgi:two-component system response regulator GlrR